MLMTDRARLGRYGAAQRAWQGIPSVEVTPKGRIFVCFYSGGVTEQNGNFSLLLKSDDGVHFGEPIAVADVGPDHRAYDSVLWIDPLGRLWYIWAVMPDNRVEFAICDDPDAPILKWSEVRTLGGDVMLNKPIVTARGEWLFPSAVWRDGLTTGSAGGNDGTKTPGAYVICSTDAGRSFTTRGRVTAKARHFDEHMLLELKNGDLEMYVRTTYGIGKAVSHDGGFTFEQDEDSRLGGPNSRFYIGRLRSGNILLVNHYMFTGRNNLTASISCDEGRTFKGHLLLDGRNRVSYPDVKETPDGRIYIVYDRERGARYPGVANPECDAREILLACVTEADILRGEAADAGSFLGRVVSKLG